MNGAIDTHVHVWEAPRDADGRPLPRPKPWPWAPDPNPVEALLPILDEHGVELAVQVTPRLMGLDNDYSVDAADRFPTRVAVLARFDPVEPDAGPRLEALMARPGVVGVRLTMYVGETDPALIDAPALAGFWRAAEDLGAVVSIYAPADLDRVARVLERHPRLAILVDHLGAAVHDGASDRFAGFELLADLAAFPHVTVKLSGICELSERAFPFEDVHPHIARVLDAVGADRLLWGSDYPNVLKRCSYGESLGYVRETGLFTDEQLDAVLRGNAARVLAAAALRT